MSIVSSMDAILSRHAAGCSAALLSAALDAGGIRRRFMNRRSQPMAGTASCVPTAISVPSRMEMPSSPSARVSCASKSIPRWNPGIPDHHQLLQSRHPGPDQGVESTVQLCGCRRVLRPAQGGGQAQRVYADTPPGAAQSLLWRRATASLRRPEDLPVWASGFFLPPLPGPSAPF